MHLLSSLTAKAAFAIIMAEAALANPFTTIDPCPGAPPSVKHEPVTVTAQYQSVPTCAPTKVCVRGNCWTTYPFSTYEYVSTVVPCAWDGTSSSSTTVTKTDQPVRISQWTSTLTSITTVPTTVTPHGGFYRHWRKPVVIETEITKYQTVTKIAVAPYNQIGPLAFPEWVGSGLCKKCGVQPDGSRSQVVEVIECRAAGDQKECVNYVETWISRPAPSATSHISALCSTSAAVPSAGTFTWAFPQLAPKTTITAPASTVTVTLGGGQSSVSVWPLQVITVEPKPWTAYVTKSCNGPTTFDFVVHVTEIITYNIPNWIQPAST